MFSSQVPGADPPHPPLNPLFPETSPLLAFHLPSLICFSFLTFLSLTVSCLFL